MTNANIRYPNCWILIWLNMLPCRRHLKFTRGGSSCFRLILPWRHW